VPGEPLAMLLQEPGNEARPVLFCASVSLVG
jgi:hypothetical protein